MELLQLLEVEERLDILIYGQMVKQLKQPLAYQQELILVP